MRIAVISYHSSPLDPIGKGKSGGMNICISHLYKKLTQHCKIDIFTCGKTGRRKLGGSVNVIHLPCEDINKFSDSIIAFHESRKYDILHTHYWLSGIVGLLVKNSMRIPWIHSLHTVEMLKTIKKDRIRIEVEEEIMRSCDLIISPTYREVYKISERYPRARIVTIPHGVDTQRFTPSANGHSKLLFVGRIDPIKGLDLLVDALRMLKRDIELNIIGGASKGEENYESIKRYADGLPVKFHGPVKHEHLSKFYQNSGVLVVPSYYESFGLVALEAMASARPVIGFEDTGLAETVGENAGILVKRSKKNLAYAISQLVDNTELRHKLGSKGWKKSLHFDWPRIALKYKEVYEEICKN